MNSFSKSFAVILVLTVAVSGLSLWMVKPVSAQSFEQNTSFPTPSIPQFTVRLVNNSYYTQPITTTTTDPYTGQPTTTTTPSRYVQDEYVELTIKNQSFTQANGSNLFFDIRTKGHFANDWSYISPYYGYIMENYSSKYTIVQTYYNDVPSTGQIDFQVRAIIGYVYLQTPVIVSQHRILTGQNGEWSDIQTVSLPDGAVFTTPFTNPPPSQTPLPSYTPTSTPSPTPTVPELSGV